MKQGQIRIIGGQWRSRKLHFPAIAGLRPTSDRIRETLFNWLNPYIADAYCLDLFAGSGVLGLEALSRGAKNVVFTDSAKLVITYLHKQLALLCAENRATLHLSAIPQPQFAKRFTLAKPFNIVFLDPPFRQGFIKTCCQWLEQEKLLADEAYIYIETETELTTLPVPVHWQILHSKIAGQVRYYLIKRTKE